MSKPSAFAVLRLITNSNLVGACTGRSAGFDAMVEAEATFKADLGKLLKNEGHMPEDKFLVMRRKGETSWGRVCEHATR
jgi:hypothetical protein